MKRYQSRKRNGRFTKNTLQNTFGIIVVHCKCRTLANHYSVGEPKPEVCRDCGNKLEMDNRK